MRFCSLKSNLMLLAIVGLFTLSLSSCESDDEDTVKPNDQIVLDTYKVDFGTLKSASETKEVIVTLTNKSDQTLTSLSASIEFPGTAKVELNFSPLAPGQSIDVPFTYAPGSTEPGEYTGKATLTPSIGDPIVVVLKVVIEAEAPKAQPVSLDTYKVDFGTLKSASETKEIIVTLTNNSDETITRLGASIEFPGTTKVKLVFSPLAPGKSIDVPFSFAPGSTKPGEYTGKATLTPSIGDPIVVELKAVVEANS